MAAELSRRLGSNRWIWAACLYPWLLLLVLPSATTFTSALVWDASPHYMLLATAWFYAMLWVLLPVRWFFILTYPVALLGAIALAADFLRSANLLEIVMVAGGFEWREAFSQLRPYFLPIALAAVALLVPVVAALGRDRSRSFQNRARLAAIVVMALAGIAIALSARATFLRAWPINLLSLTLAAATGNAEFIATALPWTPRNPRDPKASWGAKRAVVPPASPETYVVVIGESVRADRLAACGNARPLRVQSSAIVYCDVTAASSATHTAVPLLVSRELPGSSLRVSTDATFMRAFEESGFRTYWLAVQPADIAWPDANVEKYARIEKTDRDDLLPLLRAALAEPHARKLIVLHAYNAHFPYCDRYKPEEAMFKVDCRKIGRAPTRPLRQQWLDVYDNAVAESLAFLDAIASELESRPGEAFLAYTSDHGENLLEDDRDLVSHALKFPTPYDIRVPAIFWASSTWKASHPEQWAALEAHQKSKAMHADFVPTILGAAGIQYIDPRRDVTDLTRAAPPKRTRWVLKRLGELVDGDTLQ